MTIYEHKGELSNLALAYIGDGNNVANSLMLAAALVGMSFRIASPKGLCRYREISQAGSGILRGDVRQHSLHRVTRPLLLTMRTLFTPMSGPVWDRKPSQKSARKVFAPYQINNKLMSYAKEDAILMHPLPAHYGEEVVEGILDSSQSVVFDQAENRLHVQKAVLAYMLGGLDIMIPNCR